MRLSRTAAVALLGCFVTLTAACGMGDSGSRTPDNADTQQLRALCEQFGVDPVPQPAPENPALVELGQALFFDKILSGNQNISCATCHHPTAATGDALPVSIGEGGTGLAEDRLLADGTLIPRNAPHVFNLGVEGMNQMFWDSRVTFDPFTGDLQTPEPKLNGSTPELADTAAQLTSALAAQAMFPVTSHDEMRGFGNEVADAPDNEGVWIALMARLVGTNNGTVGGIAGYRQLFQAAFPSVANFDDFTFGHAAQAIAAFERESWTALDTPFDRFIAGDDNALSAAEKRGGLLFFGQANCAECHNGPLLTDLQHHSIASPQVGPGKNAPFEDLGRELETANAADRYTFRTPPLRNVALTGPWTHAGAYMTLEGVVRHHLNPTAGVFGYDPTQLPPLFQPTHDDDFNRNGARAASADPVLGIVPLSDDEIADLLAFLNALTDPSSLDLTDDIPASVPSGLPVAD